MGKNYIVVGASSGIGKALAEQLLQKGHRVALLARRDKVLQEFANKFNSGNESKALTIKYDSHHFDKSKDVFRKILNAFNGELDGILYAAGVMHSVGDQEYNTQKDLDMMNTNLLGAIAILNPAAEYFHSRSKGFIAAISSVAGDRGRKGNPAYNASKAGLNTYLEALRNRLGSKGIQVVTVKPGFVATDMLQGVKVPQKGFLKPIPPERAAKIILSKIEAGAEEFYVPARWGIVMFLIQKIPSFIFKRLNV